MVGHLRGFRRSGYIKRMQWTGPENAAEMAASLPSEQRLKMEQVRASKAMPRLLGVFPKFLLFFVLF